MCANKFNTQMYLMHKWVWPESAQGKLNLSSFFIIANIIGYDVLWLQWKNIF